MKGKAINELWFSIENLVFLSYGITGNSLHGFYQYHPDYLVECTVCNEVKQHWKKKNYNEVMHLKKKSFL